MRNNPGGLILLNKPSGITSFRCLNTIKKELGTGKVGHTGTLDKFAEGLIVALFGKMTKLVPEFTGMDKEYEALICFGTETDTLDPEGEIIGTGEPPELVGITNAIPAFMGLIDQVPPSYSAIHIGGKRAYSLVRAGEEVSIPSRKIKIHSFEVISYKKPELKVRIRCSKGTYIRAIARDLGIKCNSRAYLKELKRLSVGSFCLEKAIIPEKFNKSESVITPWDVFDFLKNVEKRMVENKYINEIRIGKIEIINKISSDFPDNCEYALFDNKKDFLALIVKKEGKAYFRFVC
ncbi:MAG: tRNA pseudouridine(55) synthase TruB [Deltaproteobacteria bacterium]|nr:tRNA pseudouridine(55) synthase TruB [Deltaproteobacteria bacterium]